ncbi:unnamed protein product [Durusdinium trenchii]|uniref:Uncharacterized protein n=1 Tax=Durusdinium trenchii TaxID=1381693 RepID=A0ABP0S1X4_9DINO
MWLWWSELPHDMEAFGPFGYHFDRGLGQLKDGQRREEPHRQDRFPNVPGAKIESKRTLANDELYVAEQLAKVVEGATPEKTHTEVVGDDRWWSAIFLPLPAPRQLLPEVLIDQKGLAWGSASSRRPLRPASVKLTCEELEELVRVCNCFARMVEPPYLEADEESQSAALLTRQSFCQLILSMGLTSMEKCMEPLGRKERPRYHRALECFDAEAQSCEVPGIAPYGRLVMAVRLPAVPEKAGRVAGGLAEDELLKRRALRSPKNFNTSPRTSCSHLALSQLWAEDLRRLFGRLLEDLATNPFWEGQERWDVPGCGAFEAEFAGWFQEPAPPLQEMAEALPRAKKYFFFKMLPAAQAYGDERLQLLQKKAVQLKQSRQSRSADLSPGISSSSIQQEERTSGEVDAKAVSRALPRTEQELGSVSMVEYLEKSGGYKNQKTLGLIQWILAHAIDAAAQEDFAGMKEIGALLAMSVEQANYDNGDWAVAYLVSLHEDPPIQLFQERSVQVSTTSRPFSPLIPPAWTATTLSYIKDLEVLANKKPDLSKRTGQQQQKEQISETPQSGSSKRKPRYPKRPKAGAEGDSASASPPFPVPVPFKGSCADLQKVEGHFGGRRPCFWVLEILVSGRKCFVPGLCEQPWTPMMRFLQQWRALEMKDGIKTTRTDSCAFGSPHLKSFRFLSAWLETVDIEKKCDRSHHHIVVEGKYTKSSASYTFQLAKAIASCFAASIRARQAALKDIEEGNVRGLENQLMNAVALQAPWREVEAWQYQTRRHINILELKSVVRLAERLVRKGQACRIVNFGDSNVIRRTILPEIGQFENLDCIPVVSLMEEDIEVSSPKMLPMAKPSSGPHLTRPKRELSVKIAEKPRRQPQPEPSMELEEEEEEEVPLPPEMVKAEFMQNQLLEPEVVCFVATFSSLFQVLFEAYCDFPQEPRGYGGHMTISAFLRPGALLQPLLGRLHPGGAAATEAAHERRGREDLEAARAAGGLGIDACGSEAWHQRDISVPPAPRYPQNALINALAGSKREANGVFFWNGLQVPQPAAPEGEEEGLGALLSGLRWPGGGEKTSACG